MIIHSNLNDTLHSRLKNHILACNSIPILVNYFEQVDDGDCESEVIGDLEVYELVKFTNENGILTLEYVSKQLQRLTPEKTIEYKQLRLL